MPDSPRHPQSQGKNQKMMVAEYENIVLVTRELLSHDELHNNNRIHFLKSIPKQQTIKEQISTQVNVVFILMVNGAIIL